MGEATELITAISALLGAVVGLIGAIAMLAKILRQEPKDTGETVMSKLLEAAKDGELTADELRQIAEAEE